MGFKIKKLKKSINKLLKNPTHSKIFKTLDPTAHYGSKLRKKLGLTGHSLKKFRRELKSGFSFPSALNSSFSYGSSVLPPQLGSNRSVTSMY